jgi:hypothetical protein
MQLRAGALVAIPDGWEPDRDEEDQPGSRSDVEWRSDVLSGDLHNRAAETPYMTDAAALAAFRRILDGDVIATDDLKYDAARAVWNGIVDRRPAAVARCTDAADVIKAVRFAREQDLVIAVRSGGHSVGGFSTATAESLSDLSRMREVSVDPQARFARVDGAPSAAISIEKPRLSGLPVLSVT